ncbi:MAG TPA: DNA-directed RNA polymerase subunit omega [Nitrospirota bacterium]|nr:DNA-directed RNA polymerase subunit omega [Nitrospirota bacterium]
MQETATDIISLPIEMNDKVADTKFRLVHIAAQRVRQLSAGAPMLVATRSIKDTTIALEESLLDKFMILTGEEAKKAKEEFRKREERARMEEQLSAKEEEIRKELSAYLSETQGEEGPEAPGLPESGEGETIEAEDAEDEEPSESEE